MKRVIITGSADATEKLGEQIGSRLSGGEVIELVSDLGGGKTTFTRGLARGFGSVDKVSSPSFTLSREYSAGDKTMHHFDFYRLHEAGIMKDEITELVNDPLAVVIIEWADVVAEVLPPSKISIKLSPIDENTRSIEVTYTDTEQYLLEGIN